MKFKIKYIVFIFTAFTVFTGCGNEPIFTEMKTDRLKVVIKGTFETESISYFNQTDSQGIYTTLQDDSVDDVTAGSDDARPDTFMMDIAEMKIDNRKFSNYRQLIEVPFDGDGSAVPFFNGEGIVLKCDDPGDGHYDTVKVYARKMIFNNAQVYQPAGSTITYDGPAEVIFHEKDRYGFDFNQLQVNSYWDSLRQESGEIIRCFPIVVPIIGGLDYNKDDDETVLEIRFVIKNFVKKYEYDYYDEGVFKVCHYFAPSDWLRDVKAGESDIGRNIHAVARAYVPGKTGDVTVSSGAGYVVAIPSTEDINDYIATPITRGSFDCDLPLPPSYPGAYIEGVLDYYLKYEKYKVDWNILSVACGDFDTYSTEWDLYEASVENFKIAPYVAYSAGTSVTFTNMAPGTYSFYRLSSGTPGYGNLFSSVAAIIATDRVITTGNNTVP